MSVDSGIGERIKRLRREKGWTQAELADFSELERKSVIRYENGQNLPGGKALVSLARVFEVTTDYLLGLSSETRPLPASESSLSAVELEAVVAFRRARSDEVRLRLLNALNALVPPDSF